MPKNNGKRKEKEIADGPQQEFTTWKDFIGEAVLVYNWVLHSGRKHCVGVLAEVATPSSVTGPS